MQYIRGEQKPLDPVRIAVVWVRKARAGTVRWIDECTEEQFQYYSLAKRLKPFGTFAKYCLVLLTLVDAPAPCAGTAENCAKLNPQVYNVHFPVLPARVIYMFAILLYSFLALRMRLRALGLGDVYVFSGWHKFTAANIALGMAGSVFGLFAPQTARVFVICRPLVFLGASKSLRTGVMEIIHSLPGFVDVLVSFIICIAIFVWMGMVLFPGTAEGRIDFYSWGDGFAKLWTGYTTANSPNFYVPALNQNRCYFIFFFIFMLLTLFLLSNVLLAKVYDSYKESLKDKYTTIRDNQIISMQRAFSMLVDEDSNKIPVDTWNNFIAEYCDPYMGGISVGNPEDKEYNLFRVNIILKLFYSIDVERTDGIDSKTWTRILKAFFDRDIYIPSRRPPRVHSSIDGLHSLEKFFLTGTDIAGFHVQWDKIMDCVIAIGTVLTFFQAEEFAAARVVPNLMDSAVFWFLFCFSLFYFVGLNTKMFFLGFERFWYKKPLQHRFDFFNVYALLIVELIYMFAYTTDGMARAVILLHMCRAFRLFVYIEPLQQLFVIIRQLVPTFWQVLMILLIVYYIFSVIGGWCFGGLIYTSNPALQGTGFASGLYWSLSFNDLVSGMVTLFLVMLINNWYVVADGYMLASGTIWVGIFFFVWYVIANFVMINIVIAVILDGTGVVSAQMLKSKEQHHNEKEHFSDMSAELLQTVAGDPSASFMMRQILDEEDLLEVKKTPSTEAPAAKEAGERLRRVRSSIA